MKTKSPVRTSPPKAAERAVDLCLGNYYVTIGLSRHQRALLTEAGRRWGFDKRPCAEAARQLVMLGLTNLAFMSRVWEVHAKYCIREAIPFTEYIDHLAAHTLRELAGSKER